MSYPDQGRLDECQCQPPAIARWSVAFARSSDTESSDSARHVKPRGADDPVHERVYLAT